MNTVSEDNTIGAIKVSRMIWFAIILSLGTIYYCLFKYDGVNPTIMDTALQYPFTVYMRMGVMFSLFLLFLVNFFIKWWIDSAQMNLHSKRITIFGTIAILAYALFISTIDTKRINYLLAEDSVFVAAIANIICLGNIFYCLNKIHQQKPHFIGYLSWRLKKIFFAIFSVSTLFAVLIYLGQADINLKGTVEYVIVTSTYLFYWSFVYDFQGYQMDITEFIDLTENNDKAQEISRRQYNSENYI